MITHPQKLNILACLYKEQRSLARRYIILKRLLQYLRNTYHTHVEFNKQIHGYDQAD